ncbi:GUN4 domain-containing protein, partial [Geitlerinema sp. PCC 9228]|uniref:GUN4 domain-containing protein n=1 Tax=Geitlerinema sp. PCC 9228 TaxID=111611 RepID=UPI000AB38948
TPIEKQLGDILDNMLVVAVKKRYQSAGEVLRDLQPAKAASSSPPKPKSPSTTKSSQKQPPPKPKSPSPSPSTATSGSQVELRSAVGYDYTKLRDLLANQKWQEADQETAKAMLKVAGRDNFLRVEDIDNFPCEDLRTIDRLWLKFSNGKFGLSVQKEIYPKLGGTREFDVEIWEKFGDTVGWRDNDGRWKNYDELNWRRPLRGNTPGGHLPCGGWLWWGIVRCSSLLSRRDL